MKIGFEIRCVWCEHVLLPGCFFLCNVTFLPCIFGVLGVAKNLSVSTIIVNDLKRHRASEYNFSFERAYKMTQTNGLLLHVSCLIFFSKNFLSMWDLTAVFFFF